MATVTVFVGDEVKHIDGDIRAVLTMFIQGMWPGRVRKLRPGLFEVMPEEDDGRKQVS